MQGKRAGSATVDEPPADRRRDHRLQRCTRQDEPERLLLYPDEPGRFAVRSGKSLPDILMQQVSKSGIIVYRTPQAMTTKPARLAIEYEVMNG